MRDVVCILAALAVLIPTPCRSSTQSNRTSMPPFWEDLKPGPYAVGFRVLYHRDHQHKWRKVQVRAGSDPGRPIRVSLWYPAISSSGPNMNYGDYLHHTGPMDFRHINEQLDELDTESWLSDLRELTPPGQPMFEKLLSLPMAAHRDASPAPGRFPLVLYSGGKGSRADDNVELGEYLASYGYVVATVPQLGQSDQDLRLGSSSQEIALHADDFDAALEVLHKQSQIDFAHIATIGHSAGGEAAVELALRHPEIEAVVGLDGSFGMTSGSRIFKQLPGYEPEAHVNAAFLDLRRGEGAQGVKLDLRPIDSLRWRDIYRVTFAQAYHGDFTEWGMVSWTLSIPMPTNPYGHTRQIGYDVNRLACRAVLDFLEMELRGKPHAIDDLTAAVQKNPEVVFSHVSVSPETAPHN